MNPFQDLIPTRQANAGSPQQAQPQPQANPFADLIPSNPTAQPAQPQANFSYTKDLTGQGPQQKPTGMLSGLFQNTLGSGGIAGVAQMPGRVIADAVSSGDRVKYNDMSRTFSDQAFELAQQAHQTTDPKQKALLMKASQSALKNASDLMGIGEGATQNNMTPGQALGTTLNAGLTVGTSGAPGLAAKATGAMSKLALGATEGAAINSGFQVANNLQQNKPVGTDLKSAALLGAAIPVGTQALTGLKGAIQKTATLSSEGIINRIIKPSIRDLGYGSEPARGILNEKITANSLGDLKGKIYTGLNEMGQKLSQLGRKVEEKVGKTLDLTPTLRPLDEAMNKAAELNNPTLLASLNNVKVALTHDLSMSIGADGIPSIVRGNPKVLKGVGYEDAVKLMESVKDHVKFTGNPSDDKALNLAVQDTYRNLRQIMNKSAVQADTKLGSEIIKLNQRYGDLSSAQQAVSHREIIDQRKNFFDLSTKIGLGISFAGAFTTAAVTGNWAKAGTILAEELLVGSVLKAGGSVAVQTRVAKLLNALGPSERAGILQSTPVLKNLYERFTGKSANPESVLQQTQNIPTQTLSELSGMNADQVKEITPFLELGRKAAQKSGMGEQYDKLIKAISEAHKSPSMLSDIAAGVDDTNWTSTKAPLALPEGKMQLPGEGILKGQQSLKDSGAVRKTVNMESGFSKQGLTTAVGGATALGAALGRASNTADYTRKPDAPKEDNVKKIREAIAYNETRGEASPYSFSQPSGDPRYGRALGRYQIVEAELKTYAQKLLNRPITAVQFLSDPKLQDQYIEAKIKYLQSKRLSLEQIFAAHRGGFSDLSKADEKVKKYQKYVDDAMAQLK